MENLQKHEIHIGQPSDNAKIPQYDFIDELTKIREDVRGITIDGVSGLHFKKALDRILQILLDTL